MVDSEASTALGGRYRIKITKATTAA